MRVPSFRLGFSVLVSATLLSGPVPALAYEEHAESKDPCRVSYDHSQSQVWDSAAQEVYNLARERKNALAKFEVLTPEELQQAFDFYFGEDRVAGAIGAAQLPGGQAQALTEYPWALDSESAKTLRHSSLPSEKQILDYLGDLSTEFLKLRVNAQPGLANPQGTASTPTSLNGDPGLTPATSSSASASPQFPESYPEYKDALDSARVLGSAADQSCPQDVTPERNSTAGSPQGPPAAQESFFGPLAAVFGGTVSATAAIAAAWGSLDWTSILTALGSLI